MALIRYFLDEDISDKVAGLVRAEKFDVVSAHELGRRGLRDEDQLRWSANEGRCLVTRNHRDFIAWTARFVEGKLPHRGVLIVPVSLPNEDFSGIARALVSYARQLTMELPDYTVDFLRRA